MVCAVILAGGKGIRFWPLSRENTPKQMLKIVGEDTLLRQTIKRFAGYIPLDHMWIVTTESLADEIRLHLQPLGEMAQGIHFIVEPVGKNTAPAVALAAIAIKRIFSEDTVMVVSPADHVIMEEARFREVLSMAVSAAQQGYLVTFGIVPTRPETAYGYIKGGRPFSERKDGILYADGFFEKPDRKTAEEFICQGGYYWNSGIFVWKVGKILAEIEHHLPNLYKGLQRVDGVDDAGEIRMLYDSLDAVSIDHGVMEKSRDVLVIPASFGWCDLGNWASLADVLPKDERGNVIQGDAIDIGSEDSTVIAGNRVLATIGLRGIVVVDTEDATLVSSKEMIQHVRDVVEILKKNNRQEHVVHRTVFRPWGSYTVLEQGERYKIKRILVNPRARLSLQLHRQRSEHWVVVSGTARVTRGDEIFDVNANESTFIPIGVKHRLENLSDIPLQIIEVQNGDYVEEDDIERLEDDFER